jgi:hypothetical protein
MQEVHLTYLAIAIAMGHGIACILHSCCVGPARVAKGQGAGKAKKSAGAGARGPPWWVGGSEYEKGMGSDFFPIFF